jgi:hypothetical protein
MKAGIEDVLLFVISCVKSIFQQSYPIPTYEAGIE